MSTPEEAAFQEALSAIHAGEKQRARDLLTRLIKKNPADSRYWLWMSAVVESNREIIFCLKETLKRDPQNYTARRGLILQGELPLDPQMAIPLELQRRNWEPQYFSRQAIPGQLPGLSPLRLGLTIAGVLVLVAVIVIAVSGFNRQEVPAFLSWLQKYTPEPTRNTTVEPLIFASTSTQPATPTHQLSGTPEFALITATPTALYVNTLHPRTESYRSATLAFQRKDWNAAVNYLDQAIKEDPQPDLYYLQGEAYRNLDKVPEALQDYEQAISLNPRFAPPYLGRAQLRLQTSPSSTDAIRADLEKAIDLDANFLEAYLVLGDFEIDQQNDQAALDNANIALRLNPDSPVPYALRARAYLALEQPAQALSDAQKANQLDSGWLEGYRLLAEIYRAGQNLPGSIDPLTIYIRYTPDDAQAMAWLGEAYAAQGDTVNALKVLDQAIALDPLSFDALVMRAFVSIDAQDAQAALLDLNQANIIHRNRFPVYLGLGRVALLNKNGTQAWQYLSSAVRLAQTDLEMAQAYYWEALALEESGKMVDALADWEALREMPTTVLPAAQRATALQHWQNLSASATPPTSTPSPSFTPSPSQTSPATATFTPSRTLTRTSTVTPGPTFTFTPTRTILP